MNRNLRLILLCILFAPGLEAQVYQFRGLEIYSPYYLNPAFTSANKFVQVDVLAYNFSFNSGQWVNAMISPVGRNCSMGLNYERQAFDSHRANSFGLDYAYKHAFTENLSVKGGIRLIYSYTDWDPEVINGGDWSIEATHGVGLALGLGGEFRKLYLGYASYLPLIRIDKRILEDGSIVSESGNTGLIRHDVMAGYTIGNKKRFIFEPILGLNAYQFTEIDEQMEWCNYYGGKILIRNTVGLGITLGHMRSISASLHLFDHFELLLGLWSEEKSFGNLHYAIEYGFDPGEAIFISQLKVKF